MQCKNSEILLFGAFSEWFFADFFFGYLEAFLHLNKYTKLVTHLPMVFAELNNKS